jgi:hypothetical protein
MPAAIANPYINLELKIPSQYTEDFKKYTSRFKSEDGSTKDIDRSPFDRYVDFWWIAIGVGVREGRMSNTDDSEKFVTGVVLSQDPWRITHLELLAIAQTGSTDVIGRPGEVIDIANGYAATGVPILVDILLKKPEPIWDVSIYLRNLAASQQPETAPASE